MNSSSITNDRIYEITAALIAIMVVAGAVILQAINIELHQSLTDPPGWLQTAVGAVIGFYFARRSEAQTRLTYLAALEANGASKEQH